MSPLSMRRKFFNLRRLLGQLRVEIRNLQSCATIGSAWVKTGFRRTVSRLRD